MVRKDDRRGGGGGDDKQQHRRARSHHDKNRRQRNDGRYAERQHGVQYNGNDNNRIMRRSMSSIPSLRSSTTSSSSNYHTSQQNEYMNSPSGSSGRSKNSSSRGGRKSPGSPPLPPPPRSTRTIQRGRASSFHSTSTHGTLPTSNITNSAQQPRGRSLSNHHIHHPSRSSSTRHNKHVERNDDVRGRSKSSRSSAYHNAPPISSDRYNNSELPLIDAKGRHRPRNHSNNRAVKKSSSKKSQESRSRGRDFDPQVVAVDVDNNVYTANHHHQHLPSQQKSFKQFITENEEEPQQKSFKQVMAENTLLRRHSSSGSSKSSAHGSNGREQSRSTSSGRKKSSSSSSSSPRKRTKNKKRVNDDVNHQQHRSSSSTHRKFVIEISTTTNNVVQIFEFTSNGQPPPKDDKLIENIRTKYSNVMQQSSTTSTTDASDCSSVSNGSPCLEKTRKFVVETDVKQNIVRVVEISKNGISVLSSLGMDSTSTNGNGTTEAPNAPQSSRKDTSPLTRRGQEYDQKYRTNDVAEEEEDTSLSRRSASDGKKASSSSNTKPQRRRSRSLSRSRSGRDGSLRSSFKSSVSFVQEDNKSNKQPCATTNVVDNNNFDAVYKSLDTTERGRGGTFFKDQEDIQARGSSLSRNFTKDHQASSAAVASSASSALCQSSCDDGDQLSSLVALDNKSQEEESSANAGCSRSKSVTFDCIEEGDNGTLTSEGPSPDDTSRITFRRSVSFFMDSRQDGDSSQASSAARCSVSFLVNPEEEPQRGRAVSITKPITASDLPGFRHARSLSSHRSSFMSASAEPDPNVIINDTSSMTSSVQVDPPTPLTRGRSVTISSSRSSVSSMSISSKNLVTYRQARSLSRTSPRDIQPIIDFDPVSNEHQQQLQGNNNYEVVHLKDMKDTVPTALTDSLVRKGISFSYSAGDTFVSELSADSYFTNHTNQTTNAVKDVHHRRGGGQPLTNFVIFESECEEDDEESLLSEDPLSNSPIKHVNVHIMEDDDVDESNMYNAPKERRSRIRRILSRKASAKRRQKYIGGLHSSLESEDTRETVESSKSWSADDNVPHQSYARHPLPKFRISRFLHPRAA